MKRVLIFALSIIALCLSSSFAAPEKVTSVLDYYLRLPEDFLAGPPPVWLAGCGLIDEKGGYMRCRGSDAQPNFEVLLLHYTDGRPMLVVCQGQLGGDNFRFLDFFDASGDGKMQKLSRLMFPVPDGDENENHNWYFTLPHPGRTIMVRDSESEKVLHKITWNGERFVEEK